MKFIHTHLNPKCFRRSQFSATELFNSHLHFTLYQFKKLCLRFISSQIRLQINNYNEWKLRIISFEEMADILSTERSQYFGLLKVRMRFYVWHNLIRKIKYTKVHFFLIHSFIHYAKYIHVWLYIICHIRFRFSRLDSFSLQTFHLQIYDTWQIQAHFQFPLWKIDV